jgi:hypothetical protein
VKGQFEIGEMFYGTGKRASAAVTPQSSKVQLSFCPTSLCSGVSSAFMDHSYSVFAMKVGQL